MEKETAGQIQIEIIIVSQSEGLRTCLLIRMDNSQLLNLKYGKLKKWNNESKSRDTERKY